MGTTTSELEGEVSEQVKEAQSILSKELLADACTKEKRSYKSDSFVPDFTQPPRSRNGNPPPASLLRGAPVNAFQTYYYSPTDPTHDAIPQGLDASERAFLDRVTLQLGAKDISRKKGRGVSEKNFEDVEKIRSRIYTENGPEDVKSGVNATYGLQGLFSYVHLCWARERGCILSPDMIWTTVMAELARDSVTFPDRYASVFTRNPDQKEALLIPTEQVDDIDGVRIATALREKLPNESLYTLTTTDHFGETASLPGFSNVAASALAAAAAPYYDYISFMCGITGVAVMGGEQAWQKLVDALGELKNEVTCMKCFELYVDKVIQRVQKIMQYAYHEEPRLASAFFGGMYWCTASCGSGAPYYCRGWISEFAMRTANFAQYLQYTEEKDIQKPATGGCFSNITEYPAHLMIVPFTNMETQRKFVKCSGLFYCVEAEGWLVPRYGDFVYEIKSDKLKF